MVSTTPFRSLFRCSSGVLAAGLLAVLAGTALLYWKTRPPTLAGTRLPYARLAGACLRRVDMRGIELDRAVLTGAELARANLEGASLRDVRARAADFRGAVLERADLSRADLEHASLAGAVLRGARLDGADLRHADLERADLRGCTYTRDTAWPEGVNPVSRGARCVPRIRLAHSDG